MAARLAGKTAIVTGGANGIGRATVLRFLAEGAKVVIADIDTVGGEATVAAARDLGRADVCFIRTDVTQEADVEAAVDHAVATFGQLDCVMNNAGTRGAVGRLVDISATDWDDTQAMLLRSVFLGIKHGARAMIARGTGGVILSTASVAGLIGGVAGAGYSTAKAAVIRLTEVAAVELATHRIRVMAISPGGILTRMNHDGDIAAGRRMLDGAQPWPHAGEPDDIANTAVFLASDEARFVTGANLVVDGALIARGIGLTAAGAAR